MIYYLTFAAIYGAAACDMARWRTKEWPAIGMLAVSSAFFTVLAFQ